MTANSITAREAAGLIASGQAVLVDIREADERARSHVAGSAHAPVSRLGSAALGIPPGSTVIFHCQSGSRTAQNAPAHYAAGADCCRQPGGAGRPIGGAGGPALSRAFRLCWRRPGFRRHHGALPHGEFTGADAVESARGVIWPRAVFQSTLAPEARISGAKAASLSARNFTNSSGVVYQVVAPLS